MKNKISCIIPAYNEGKRIAGVLKVVKQTRGIDEIVVVNDGSTDDTQKIVEKFKVHLINHKVNQGKSSAILTGVKKSKGNILMFVDADLIGLTSNDLKNLIDPVIENKADISISMRKNAPLLYRWVGIDFSSGDRVFYRDLIPNYNKLKALLPFGIEVFMNKQIIKKKLRIKIVKLYKAESPYPDKKFGFWKGHLRTIYMLLQMLRTAGIYGTIAQIFQMKRQAV
jgi:glycosyltransferase involved in cell wall biosynthesis